MEEKMVAAYTWCDVCAGGAPALLALFALLGWIFLRLAPVRYGTDAAICTYASSEAAATDRARTLRRLSIPTFSWPST